MPTETEHLFSMPSEELVRHALRNLSYAERLTGTSASPAAGNQRVEMYSFAQAGKFLIGNDWTSLLSDGTKASLNWVDMAKLVNWFRDVIGDAELAEAVEHRLASSAGSYREQAEAAGSLVKARFTQYMEVIGPVEEQHADEAEPAG